jgi:hypothetical protein
VALWPAQFIQAYLALPEVAVRLGFLMIVIATFGLLRNGGWHKAVMVAALAIICFAMHPRMVVIIPLCLLIIFIAKLRGQISWGAIAASIAIVITGYFAIDALNEVLQKALWVTRLTTMGIFKRMVLEITADPLAMLARTFGHFWYQLASSLLMIPLGVIIAMRWVICGTELDAKFTAALILLATAAMGVLGAASLLNWEQLDGLVYGRYLDIVTPTLFWFGLLGVRSVDWRKKLANWVPLVAGSSIIGGGILYFFYSGIAASRSLNLIEVGAFMPVLQGLPLGDEAVRLFLVAPVISVILGILCFVVGGRTGRLLVALSVVIGVATIAIELFYLHANASGEVSTAAAAEVYAKANQETIHLDRSTVGGHVYIHQYMLKMHFPVSDLVAEPRSVGEFATIGPSVFKSVSGECLGAIDNTNLLVRVGDGNPTNCPP